MDYYKVYIDPSGIGEQSVLLYEGDNRRLAMSFIPDIYVPGGLNGNPCYVFVRIIALDDDQGMEVMRYVWHESIKKDSWFKRLIENM